MRSWIFVFVDHSFATQFRGRQSDTATALPEGPLEGGRPSGNEAATALSRKAFGTFALEVEALGNVREYIKADEYFKAGAEVSKFEDLHYGKLDINDVSKFNFNDLNGRRNTVNEGYLEVSKLENLNDRRNTVNEFSGNRSFELNDVRNDLRNNELNKSKLEYNPVEALDNAGVEIQRGVEIRGGDGQLEDLRSKLSKAGDNRRNTVNERSASYNAGVEIRDGGTQLEDLRSKDLNLKRRNTEPVEPHVNKGEFRDSNVAKQLESQKELDGISSSKSIKIELNDPALTDRFDGLSVSLSEISDLDKVKLTESAVKDEFENAVDKFKLKVEDPEALKALEKAGPPELQAISRESMDSFLKKQKTWQEKRSKPLVDPLALKRQSTFQETIPADKKLLQEQGFIEALITQVKDNYIDATKHPYAWWSHTFRDFVDWRLNSAKGGLFTATLFMKNGSLQQPFQQFVLNTGSGHSTTSWALNTKVGIFQYVY